MDTKNQRAVYEWAKISDDLVYEWVRFLEARYMNGVGFEILARTSVSQLTPSYTSPATAKDKRFPSVSYVQDKVARTMRTAKI